MFTLMIINKIHWLGVGLSSPPGILYLNEQRYDLIVWNRSVDKAQSLLKNKIYVNQLNISSLSKKLDRNGLSPIKYMLKNIKVKPIAVLTTPTTPYLKNSKKV